MKKLYFISLGFLLLLNLIACNSSRKEGVENNPSDTASAGKLIIEKSTFTHQTSASRFCNQPDVKSFPAAPSSIPIPPGGHIIHNFVQDGNFGNQQSDITYDYKEVDSVTRTFYLRDILRIDGCNHDPRQPDGAWLKGFRTFTFDFVLPATNEFDVSITKNSTKSEINCNFIVILENLSTGITLPSNPIPYTFQNRPPGKYRCTINCDKMFANLSAPGIKSFENENTITVQFFKVK